MNILSVENDIDFKKCLELRETIFVQEQNIPIELENDELDSSAKHFLLLENSMQIGVARVVKNGKIAIIGRVGVLKNFRKTGAGTFLIKEIIEYCKSENYKKIVLGSQEHAVGFYSKLGFKISSERYMDANIPHYKMELILT